MDRGRDPSAGFRKARQARSAHRARQHDAAHAETEERTAPRRTIPDAPGGEAEMVSTAEELRGLIQQLRTTGRFAYDSEFIGELTYLPKLCLIQVATTQRITLVDPLAGLDLKPFWELMADPTVEKVVHAGEQDIEPVVRHIERAPQNIFDVQLAAGFIGMAYPVALHKLVEELTGVRLGKGLTFTHWDQRPLSALQLRYAADDVRYLLALRRIMGERLEALGHAQWAREEFDALCDTRLYHFNPEKDFLRVRGANALSAQQLAVLRELTIWRDAMARAHDVPPRTLIKDEVLVDLSRNPVKDVERLGRVRGLPRPVEHAHGAEIVSAIRKGLAATPPRVPSRRPEPTASERFGADALWAAAQCLCIGQKLDPSLVTSRQEISELYRHLAHGGKEPHVRVLSGWRRSAVGDRLRSLVKSGGSITLEWAEGLLRAK